MSLQKQIIDMPFARGLDTKTDPFQVPLGKLVALNNATFETPGRLTKRNGYSALVQSILGGGSISSSSALFARDNELCQVGGSAAPNSTLYSYSPGLASWVSKGSLPSVTTSVASVAQPQFSTLSIDMAVATNGLQCFVFEIYDTNKTVLQGLGYSVFDPASGALVVAPVLFETTAISVSPHVIALGNTFVCYYAQTDPTGLVTAVIMGRTLSALAPQSGWSAATQLTSGTTTSALRLANGQNFDTCVQGSNAYLSFSNRSSTATVFQVTTAAPLVVANTAVISTASSPGVTCIFPDAGGSNVFLGVLNAISTLAATLGPTLAVVNALTVVGDGGSSVTGVSAAANSATYFWGAVAGTTSQRITQNTFNGGVAGSTGATAFVFSVGIAAKAFLVAGKPYLPCWYSINAGSLVVLNRIQSDQNTIFVVDGAGNVIAKALGGLAAGYDGISSTNLTGASSYQLASTVVNGSSVVFPAAASNLLERAIEGAPTQPFGTLVLNYQYGVSAVSLNFADSVSSYQRQELAGEVHVNGGVLQMYDGQNVVEHGFLTYPIISLTANSSGSPLAAGTYEYVGVYEWMDGQGLLHRSKPSVPVSITITAGQVIHIAITPCCLTKKVGIMLQLYRSQVNATTLTQITNYNQQGSFFSAKTQNLEIWDDSAADSSIVGNPTLYTAGNVLENAAAPASGAMTVHRNRLFVVDTTNPLIIWYSKQLVSLAPVEFSDFQTISVDPKGGPVTALASLDDKLIIFKRDRIFMLLGQGPDITGGQNDFTDPLPVSTDTGCIAPRSVVVVPDGIMFHSPKGIYQLGRDLSVSFIGAPVAGVVGPDALSSIVSSAVLMPDTHQVRFGILDNNTSNLFCVVYDYLVGQWSDFKLGQAPLPHAPNGADACLVGGVYYSLSNASGSAAVLYEVPGQTNDLGGAIQMAVITGWIKLTGLQGFQRAYKLQMLGTGSGTLFCSIGIDYTPAPLGAFFAVAAGPNFQHRVDFATQKCEAFQVTLSELFVGASNFTSISGLAVEVGLKRGLKKLPAANSTGGF